ncbi:helix-turn-helix domain-containing protein [Laribacter hongkongensis]|uniref:Helix-turn-helix domain-containing protein n=2 Tax=Laribacter hongkongensis TaxID=168471 RepID=A0ABD4SUP1_9NEIS|nr:S24 family peptidase [Laribacter hongkongensis]MCG9026732.1 helix-turn-helix domain-containing protein [Laribacter hongkongensis]MCG9101616.1 helix-turn-helix domain-containing protein [Laribacter hongkongensis]MCG9104258.1 helix-turn-helix domain-containing protein [Laribacter hongkongensis]MCG9113491.1 helix-turn-helix domain-containing protein [Laribacter hongkongensis]MCG9119229.1 helix-turn-helix domain-containing protein [Laribacter hongkongensis]
MLAVSLTYMALSDRLKLALAQSGKTRAELTKHIGIKAPSMTAWLDGTTKNIKSENLLKAAAFLGVSAEWLVSGKGEMKQEDWGAPIETPFRPVVVIDADDQADDRAIIVPRYTLKASAGTGLPVLEIDTEGQPNYCRSGWAKKNGYKPGDLFSLAVKGTSMEPTIPDGASIIVHRQQEIVNGKPHVICRGNECFVKRLYKQFDGSILVRSDNQELYKDYTINDMHNDDPPLHIVGLVVSVSFMP